MSPGYRRFYPRVASKSAAFAGQACAITAWAAAGAEEFEMFTIEPAMISQKHKRMIYTVLICPEPPAYYHECCYVSRMLA